MYRLRPGTGVSDLPVTPVRPLSGGRMAVVMSFMVTPPRLSPSSAFFGSMITAPSMHICWVKELYPWPSLIAGLYGASMEDILFISRNKML